MFRFDSDPFQEFERELHKAVEAAKDRNGQSGLIKEPTAMSLATVNSSGQPQVRTVLFKGLVRQGFSFFTNYNSPKAKQLMENPRASLLFLWTPLEQQIRIEGKVEKLTRAESEAYFKTRPRESQLGAWASQQSQEIPSYEFLQTEFDSLEKKFSGKEIPCPEHWGGFHLLPTMIEFWFGKQGRLHERYVYERKSPQDSWRKYMKSP